MAVVSVKSGYAVSDGVPINFLEWGDLGAPALVMLPTLRHQAFELREIAEQLQDRYRVIVVNLRGIGDSGAWPTREYNPAAYTADLKAVFTRLQLGSAVLFGYSVVMTGACVGFAVKYPDLVRGLIFVDGGFGHTQEGAASARPRVRKMPRTFPDWQTTLKYFGDMSDQRYSPRKLHEERAPYIFRQLPNGEVTWKHDRILHEAWPGDDWARDTGAHPPEVLEQIRCRICIIEVGGHSHLQPGDAEKLTKYGHGSYQEAVPHVSQLHVHAENPAGFARIIRSFLEKIYTEGDARQPAGASIRVSTPAIRSGYVLNGTLPLHFHEWGSRNAPDLLFIAPLRAAAYDWKPIIEKLDDRFHCIALNLRAHGDSGPMLSPYTDVNGYVSDIAAAIKQLELRTPTIIAFAPLMVGAVVKFAAEHPDLAGALVLGDGGLGLRPHMLPAVKKRQSERPTSFKTWNEAVEFLRKMSAEPVQALAEERAPYHYRLTADGTVEVKHDLVLRDEYVRDEAPPYVGILPESVWEAVRCPLFFMVPGGGTQHLPIDEAKRLVRYGKDSEWLAVPNSNHYIFEENPDGFIQALAHFLKRINGAERADAVLT